MTKSQQKKHHSYKKKTTRKHGKKNKTQKLHGGKVRTENIYVTLGRQHTNPDIRSVIKVKSDPTHYKAENRTEFVANFISEVTKELEEDLATVLRGVPESVTKQKVYKLEFKDNDAPNEVGAEKAIKCKRQPKTKEAKQGKEEQKNEENKEKEEEEEKKEEQISQ